MHKFCINEYIHVFQKSQIPQVLNPPHPPDVYTLEVTSILDICWVKKCVYVATAC